MENGAVHAGGRGIHEIIHVIAGGEAIANAGKKHRFDLIVTVRFTQKLRHLGIHLCGNCVLFFGAGKGNGAHAIFEFAFN
jgi:hypothetical protein